MLFLMGLLEVADQRGKPGVTKVFGRFSPSLSSAHLYEADHHAHVV